jgi:hypothetical protein
MGRKGMRIAYWWESHKDRDHLEDQHVGAWLILTRFFDKMEYREWIDLAQDRDQWRALVNTIMNIRVP